MQTRPLVLTHDQRLALQRLAASRVIAGWELDDDDVDLDVAGDLMALCEAGLAVARRDRVYGGTYWALTEAGLAAQDRLDAGRPL